MSIAIRLMAHTLLASILSLLMLSAASAATITVDTLEDRIDRRVCSLRAAVEAAHIDRRVGGCKAGAPGSDTIRFQNGLGGKIGLRSPLVIESSLSIEGPGADRLALAEEVVQIQTDGTAQVNLSELGMMTGLLIRSAHTVNIRGLRFQSIRSAMSRASAIQVQGNRFGPVDTITIRNSSFEGNEGADSPLAVVGETRHLVLRDVDFFGNRGDLAGAILLDGAGPIEVDLADSHFLGNQAISGFAGAVAVLGFGEAQLRLARNLYQSNRGQEAGALYFLGDRLRIENSVFYRNGSPNAGAIRIDDLTGTSGDSQLLFSTLVDNDAIGWGPALVNHGGNSLWMRGNLLRPGDNAWAVCEPQGLQSFGHNIEIDSGSCQLYGSGDTPYAYLPLFMLDSGLPYGFTPVPDPDYFVRGRQRSAG